MPRNLDLTTLRSFVAVADVGGVTRASGFLNLTQSAVSMQLKRLEDSLDTQLLDRSARTIALTAAGEQLLGYARQMLALNDEVYGRLTDQAFEGEVVLGVPHDIVYPSIPHVLRRFNAEYPRRKVQLLSSDTRTLKEKFRRGKCDMILTTEELSRASLAGAGSLITRPEILAKALLGGGTEEQKAYWLPKLASGEIMVGIAVTEPGIGSDVASLRCRAERATVDGVEGWVLNGPKAWCTFAGRADVLALLARTDPDLSKGQKGLSLFIVPKESSRGHEFECIQPGGGRMSGKADATPGYRGMHSFTLQIENYFVPGENLVGGEAQLNRGFYLQMAGFGAGRLQTSGRACGLAQGSLEETARYVVDRDQFGQPISEFQLTQFTLGRMAARIAGARAITYAAALAFDVDPRAAGTLASQAKLLACDVAVAVSQDGQVLHGGWGYAEEYPISRYVVDATVLPIFEGVKAILELKVIGRAILSG